MNCALNRLFVPQVSQRSVTDLDYVRLDRVVGGRGRHACGDISLIKVTLSVVRVVSPRSENDGALLHHGLVVPRRPDTAREFRVWAGPIVHRLELALRCVATLEREAIRAALEVQTYKIRGERGALVVHDGLRAAAVVHAGLQIGAGPGTFPQASVMVPTRVPEINRLHSAGSATPRDELIVLRISVVETTAIIVVGSAHYRKDGLWIVALRDANCDIHIVAVTWVEPHAVDIDAASDTNFVLRCVDHLVVDASLARHAADALGEVIPSGRLVIDFGNIAVPFDTEYVLETDIGKATRHKHTDVHGPSIVSRYFIEGTRVIGVQSANGAVRGNARVASSG